MSFVPAVHVFVNLAFLLLILRSAALHCATQRYTAQLRHSSTTLQQLIASLFK